jgi:hypothetical protein
MHTEQRIVLKMAYGYTKLSGLVRHLFYGVIPEYFVFIMFISNIYIYIYIYVCVCVCVNIYIRQATEHIFTFVILKY